MPLVLNPPSPLQHALEVEALNTECPVEEFSEALLHIAMVLLGEYDAATLPEAAVRILRDRELVTSEEVAAAFDETIKPLLDDSAARRRAARLAEDPEARRELARQIRGSFADLRHTVREPIETPPGVVSSPIVDDFLRRKREDHQRELEREERRWAGRSCSIRPR